MDQNKSYSQHKSQKVRRIVRPWKGHVSKIYHKTVKNWNQKFSLPQRKPAIGVKRWEQINEISREKKREVESRWNVSGERKERIYATSSTLGRDFSPMKG